MILAIRPTPAVGSAACHRSLPERNRSSLNAPFPETFKSLWEWLFPRSKLGCCAALIIKCPKLRGSMSGDRTGFHILGQT
jgi:hypothetical protein